MCCKTRFFLLYLLQQIEWKGARSACEATDPLFEDYLTSGCCFQDESSLPYDFFIPWGNAKAGLCCSLPCSSVCSQHPAGFSIVKRCVRDSGEVLYILKS